MNRNPMAERYTRGGAAIRGKAGERGATLILFSFMLTSVLIPIIGLAIDGSICWWMKTKLSSAVDAAALAAARSLSLASSASQLQSTGATVGTQYFNANFPAGVMGTTLSKIGGQTSPVITVVDTNAQVITVTVQAVIQVPMYFLRIFGYKSVTLGDAGQSTRRNTNIIFVLDRSYSMQQAGVCSQVASNAEAFINTFVEGRDTLGLITFQTTANVDYAPSTTFKTATTNLLNTMVCTGYTSTAEALSLAWQEIQTINQPAALNLIFLLTDGQPDSFAAQFPIKTYADTRYDPINTSTYEETPPSGCLAAVSASNATLTGVLTDALGSPDATGYTAGIFADVGTAINYSSPYILPTSTISAAGCAFPNSSNYPTYTAYARMDLAYLPALDLHNNALTGYKTLDYYPAGSPYAGQPRIDTPVSVMNAATNAAANMANTIRSNGIYIYTVGLGGTPEQAIDSDFLMRVANDPLLPASEFNPNQPVGHFAYANASSLASVLAAVASQILHLSQ
jgi:Flp pilus assembly protein TadG